MAMDSDFSQSFTRSSVKKVKEKGTIDEETLRVKRYSTVKTLDRHIVDNERSIAGLLCQR